MFVRFCFGPHGDFGILRVEVCLWISAACSVHPSCTDTSGAQGGSSDLIDASDKMWSFYKAFSTHSWMISASARRQLGRDASFHLIRCDTQREEEYGCWTSQCWPLPLAMGFCDSPSILGVDLEQTMPMPDADEVPQQLCGQTQRRAITRRAFDGRQGLGHKLHSRLRRHRPC